MRSIVRGLSGRSGYRSNLNWASSGRRIFPETPPLRNRIIPTSDFIVASLRRQLREKDDVILLQAIRNALGRLELRCKVRDGSAFTRTGQLHEGFSWGFTPDVYRELVAQLPDAVTQRIIAKISEEVADCSAAEVDAKECPEKGKPSSDCVHAHVTAVLDGVMRALQSLARSPVAGLDNGVPVDFFERVAMLYQHSYNNRRDLEEPDNSFVYVPSTSAPPLLMAETQLMVVECKKRSTLIHAEASRGELQAAGYVAQQLVPQLDSITDADEMRASPLRAYGVYTDSVTATLIEVTVTAAAGVAVRAHRMPLLGTTAVPRGTVCSDGGIGASVIALALLSGLRDYDVCSVASGAKIRVLQGKEVVIASLLGRGVKGAAYATASMDSVFKVPTSSLASATVWAESIAREFSALRALGVSPLPCSHIPALSCSPLLDCTAVDSSRSTMESTAAAPVNRATLFSTDVLAALAEGAAPFESTLRATFALSPDVAACIPVVALPGRDRGHTRHCVALITQPICTPLLAACDDARAAVPLEHCTVSGLVTFALAVVAPVISAIAHARQRGISHCDVSVRNVGLHNWNVRGYAHLRTRVTTEALSEHEVASVAAAESGATAGVGPVCCDGVFLLDWGEAKVSVRKPQRSAAHELDVRQCVELAYHVLEELLGARSSSKLRDVAADDVVGWWQGVLSRKLAIDVRWAAPAPSDETTWRHEPILFETMRLLCGGHSPVASSPDVSASLPSCLAQAVPQQEGMASSIAAVAATSSAGPVLPPGHLPAHWQPTLDAALRLSSCSCIGGLGPSPFLGSHAPASERPVLG
jgi:hypothetical protein